MRSASGVARGVLHVSTSGTTPASIVSNQQARHALPRRSPLVYRGPLQGLGVSTRASSVSAMSAATEIKAEEPPTKFRKDYAATPYLIDSVSLDFVLNDDVSHVHSKIAFKPSYAAGAPPPLVLDGRKDITLVSVKINGVDVPATGYALTEKTLTIEAPPAGAFELAVTVAVKPQDNSLLEGLYKTSGNFCTQCEAEGFRGITYFYDRPDVMTTFTTRIEAPKAYPVLLGNGNLKESGDLDGDRHFTVWEDPFRKPCYLFALVAGNLAMKERDYTTCSGKAVKLRIFTAEKDISKVDFALDSLVKSMKWDEDTYGLEYDLELFNIVAVDDFNMGAMENKSLNIFNSRLVLASPDTATDGDYGRIEGVVGHEYFHNWTGNRVTCRDWFQLTLKEGLTVFRDQGFSGDTNSAPVKRIEDVSVLRASQFTEDAGPMAHSIRPDSYIKMDNFYTVTVYEKGAEVVRMYQTLLGKEGFRKGMDLYFKRHDGHAVTCDDFLAAMADANGADLEGMKTWYSQAGTPRVEVSTQYNAASQTFTLTAKQSTGPSPGQTAKAPVLIPLAVGLLGADGKDMALTLQDGTTSADTTVVLRLEKTEQSFVFTGVSEEPTLSVLRGFSAPVKLTVLGQSDEQLLFLFANDSDPFNRWESGQRLLKKLLLQLYTAVASKGGAGASSRIDVSAECSAAGGVGASLAAAFKGILTDPALDGMFKTMAMSIPPSAELLDSIPGADPVLLYEVRMFVVRQLAARLRPELEAAMKANEDAPGEPYAFNSAACARRALKNKSLAMLASLAQEDTTRLALERYQGATNMTDTIAALSALVELKGPERATALDAFYGRWKAEPLVLLKWLGLQAMSNAPGNLELVKTLEADPSAFNVSNPNNCYSLYLGFARSPINFHAADGSGYKWMADSVLKVDKINHQVAARMASAFTTYRQYDTERQAMMKAQLQRIVDHQKEGLSENVYEIASKTLVDA
ncbi:hypothetical protein FOA52_007829 [Chlamydomonas sp. UWO 241]|nr:hypothetical protein FOA52_007829 [Chlamydomonas sp. UWO 241]